MMTEPLSGPALTWATVVPIGSGYNSLGNGLAAITWSQFFPCHDAEQLGIAVVSNGGPTSPVLQLRWSPDGAANAANAVVESIEGVSAISAGYQRYPVLPKEWGPLVFPPAPIIYRPVAMPFFSIGLYDTVGEAADVLTLFVARQRGAQLQASGS